MSIDQHRATDLVELIIRRIKSTVIGIVARRLAHIYDIGYADCRTEFKHVIDAAWRLLNARNNIDADAATLALRELLQEGEW